MASDFKSLLDKVNLPGSGKNTAGGKRSAGKSSVGKSSGRKSSGRKRSGRKRKNMPGSEYTFDDLVYYTKRYVSRHMKVIMPVVLLVCVVVTVGIALITHRNHPNEVAAGAASEETENLPLEKDAYPDVNALFKTYYDAMAGGDTDTIESISTKMSGEEKIRVRELSVFIDTYPVIEVYTKKGPVENSYVCFVYNKLKFEGHDWEIPGLQTMYAAPREDGTLYIDNDDQDDATADYINTVSLDDDVVDLNNQVTAEYNELLAADPSITEYLNELSANIDVSVGQALATMVSTEGDTSDSETGSGTFVMATDVVNVRDSDSTDGNKIGATKKGSTYELIRDEGNGWYSIIYNGQKAYVKAEYFTTVDMSEGDDSGSASTQDAAEADSSSEASDGADSGGSGSSSANVTKAVVNQDGEGGVAIRDKASTDGTFLTSVNPGDTLSVESYDKDGWSKVRTGGIEGYIKSEFIDPQ